MTAIDLDRLLRPVAEDAAAGPDLEYDPAYLAAFRAAEGTPERQIGTTVVSAEGPDWRHVQELAADLLAQSKDLRVAVLLNRALLWVEGLDGLNTGLALIHGLLDRYWDLLYPRLDPEDENDPTARVNCLLDLCDREQLLDVLRDTALVQSRVFGPLTYRAIEIAEGRATAPPHGKTLDAAAVNGALQDCDGDELKGATAAAASALDRVRAILDILGARIRTDQLPNLDPLTGVLSAIDKTLRARLSQRFPQGADAPQQQGNSVPPAQGSAQAAELEGMPGQLRSREDVVRAIDRICDYYSHYEPSSPVPLLLQRARRLATGSFVDIMRDLAPGALGEIEKVCGLDKEP